MIANFFSCMERAYRQALSMLWPFHKGVWLKLFLLYVLTGGCGTGFNFNLPGPSSFGGGSKPATSVTAPELPPSASKLINPFQEIKQQLKNKIQEVKTFWNENKRLIVSLALIVFFFLLLLTLLLFWLACRLKFVLIQSLMDRQIEIRKNWTQTKTIGESYFRWNLALVLIILLPPILAGTGLLIAFINKVLIFKTHWPLILTFIILGVLYMMVTSLVAWVFQNLAPILMIKNKSLSGEAGRFLVQLFKSHFWRRLGLIILYGLASIVIGIGVAIASLFVIIPLVLLGVAVGGVGYLMFKSAGMAVLITLGAVWFALGILVMTALAVAITVPVSTFFNYLKIDLVETFFRTDEFPSKLT